MTRPQITVLLVDDNEVVLTVTEMQLESLGYKVFGTLSPREALSAFEVDPHSFDLVITDGQMPEISGIQLAQTVLSIRPDMTVVLCTGFAPDFTPEMARGIGCSAYVMKPMSVADWRDVISHVLSRSDFYSKE